MKNIIKEKHDQIKNFIKEKRYELLPIILMIIIVISVIIIVINILESIKYYSLSQSDIYLVKNLISVTKIFIT